MKSLGLAIKKNEIWYSVVEGDSYYGCLFLLETRLEQIYNSVGTTK